MAAQLWAGDGAVISHRSAAALWKLDGVEPGVVELTTTGRRSSVPNGIELHRTNDLALSDFGYRGPFRVTGVVRTLIDLGAVVEDPAVVEAAMECALRRGDADLMERLARRLESLGAHGRRGAGVLREILALRDPDARPTEGMFETLVERMLRETGIERPVRQHEVRDEDGNLLARIDFFWPEKGPERAGVGLEPDGERWHDGRAGFQAAGDRANALALTRITIIRVTWQDLVRRPGEIVATLRLAMRERCAIMGASQDHERKRRGQPHRTRRPGLLHPRGTP